MRGGGRGGRAAAVHAAFAAPAFCGRRLVCILAVDMCNCGPFVVCLCDATSSNLGDHT